MRPHSSFAPLIGGFAAAVVLLVPSAPAAAASLHDGSTTTTVDATTTTTTLRDRVACTQRLSFEEAPAGTIVAEARTDAGDNIVGIEGRNPRFPDRNAALLFDSTCAGGCTGGDDDLGAPNADFGGPGVGIGGSAAGIAPNATALGNVLIVAESLADVNGDGLVDVPDDQAMLTTQIEFDFAPFGSVAVERLTIVDVEANETAPTLELFAADGGIVGKFALPRTGNNGVARATFAPMRGVARAVVTLHGSAAIDNVLFSSSCDDGDPCTIDLCDEGRGCLHDAVPGCGVTSTLPAEPTTTLAPTTTSIGPVFPTLPVTTTTHSAPTTTTPPAPTTTTPAADERACGDADSDGRVTAVDAAVVLHAAVSPSLVACAATACDVNGDERIDTSDALHILVASVGLQPELLCGRR